jgi:hypothetical protein
MIGFADFVGWIAILVIAFVAIVWVEIDNKKYK